jgi:FAD/FMN-containing dehydrogenase
VLHGSSPDVGVVGYSLGGGIGWYARQHGMATNSVTAVELVTAEGEQLRVDADHFPDLFWAVRGGGGSFGVVTAMELRLFDFDTAYGGMMLWDQRHADQVLRRWVAWAVDGPDSVTTSFRMLNLPPLPEIPEFLRGRRLVVIDGAVLADDARAEEILAPLRELRPEMDTFARVPSTAMTRVHMDPEQPTPAVSSAGLLRELPEAAIETFLALTDADSGSSLLFAELRQLGGALGRPAPGAGALPMLDGAFALFAIAVAATPELAAQGHADATALVDALAPYASGQYLNFAEQRVDVRQGYDEQSWPGPAAMRSAAHQPDIAMNVTMSETFLRNRVTRPSPPR